MKTQSILSILILVGLLLGSIPIALKHPATAATINDRTQLVDINVTVTILKIRALDKNDVQVHKESYIEKDKKPNLFVKIFIDNQEFTSPVWTNQQYIYTPDFSATVNVPVGQNYLTVKIQLWDHSPTGDDLCDIGNTTDDATMNYSVQTGHWTGDDHIGDPSGYGRLNGCDDKKIYGGRGDAELWFTITQTDFGGDGVPYWMKTNVYQLDPYTDYSTYDPNNDGIPLPWDWKWTYDPFSTDNHAALDPENDGLSNKEEYLTSQWGSDPFAKDLFVELDQMSPSPTGETSIFPDDSKEILYTAYDRYNLVYHLDDGTWNGTCSEMIPFDNATSWEDLDVIYSNYFLRYDGQPSWRLGIFHYGVLVYQCEEANGMMFNQDAYQISSHGLDGKMKDPLLNRTVVYASAYMHECGHTLLGWVPIPGHNSRSGMPWQLGWWLNRPYKSCMNYGYMFYTVDYSDGSRPIRDYDDWERMDLTNFQNGGPDL
jgi:hypothetical protein